MLRHRMSKNIKEYQRYLQIFPNNYKLLKYYNKKIALCEILLNTNYKIIINHNQYKFVL